MDTAQTGRLGTGSGPASPALASSAASSAGGGGGLGPAVPLAPLPARQAGPEDACAQSPRFPPRLCQVGTATLCPHRRRRPGEARRDGAPGTARPRRGAGATTALGAEVRGRGHAPWASCRPLPASGRSQSAALPKDLSRGTQARPEHPQGLCFQTSFHPEAPAGRSFGRGDTVHQGARCGGEGALRGTWRSGVSQIEERQVHPQAMTAG